MFFSNFGALKKSKTISYQPASRWWQLKYVFIFTPRLGDFQFDIYFSDGLLQPPTWIVSRKRIWRNGPLLTWRHVMWLTWRWRRQPCVPTLLKISLLEAPQKGTTSIWSRAKNVGFLMILLTKPYQTTSPTRNRGQKYKGCFWATDLSLIKALWKTLGFWFRGSFDGPGHLRKFWQPGIKSPWRMLDDRDFPDPVVSNADAGGGVWNPSQRWRQGQLLRSDGSGRLGWSQICRLAHFDEDVVQYLLPRTIHGTGIFTYIYHKQI